jgi:hypothetical protein
MCGVRRFTVVFEHLFSVPVVGGDERNAVLPLHFGDDAFDNETTLYRRTMTARIRCGRRTWTTT